MLHVVHHVDYMAPAPTRGSFRFDKYMLVMVALRESGIDMTEHAPEPMPRAWLEAVHDPDYVEQVFSAQVPREKERRIGFPVTPHIAQRVAHTNGGTWPSGTATPPIAQRAATMRSTIPARDTACSTTSRCAPTA